MDILMTTASIFEIIPDQDFDFIQNICKNYQNYTGKGSVVNFINIFLTKHQRKTVQTFHTKVKY
jgi:hypothetical protein